MQLQLYFGTLKVGRIADSFEHQGTWFGNFFPADTISNDARIDRLAEFAKFCCDWNARLSRSANVDVDDFNEFNDVIARNPWYTLDELGNRTTICDAPMFHDGWGGELSWTFQSELKT